MPEKLLDLFPLELAAAHPSGLYLHLYHGRLTSEEQMQDWGSNGPYIGPLAWFHGTYLSTFSVGFADIADKADREAAFDDSSEFLTTAEGLIFFNGVYYGDFELVYHEQLAGV